MSSIQENKVSTWYKKLGTFSFALRYRQSTICLYMANLFSNFFHSLVVFFVSKKPNNKSFQFFLSPQHQHKKIQAFFSKFYIKKQYTILYLSVSIKKTQRICKKCHTISFMIKKFTISPNDDQLYMIKRL